MQATDSTSLKVLHAASLMTPKTGMLMQMGWEQKAADRSGISWTARMYSPKNAVIDSDIVIFDEKIVDSGRQGALQSLVRWVSLRYRYHQWVKSIEHNYDVIILRYYVHDPFQLFYVMRCKKPLYFMCHTLAVEELSLGGGIRPWVRSTLESWIGKLCLNRCDGVLGISEEVVEHESARARQDISFKHPFYNGILTDKAGNMALDNRHSTKPEILFVANFMPWQGVEELLVSMESNRSEFILHIVGEVRTDLAEKISKDSRLVMHGVLTHDEIRSLAARCWIGLSNLELKKKNMTQNSPLKVRQYLAFGLPVYGNRDVFPTDFRFYCIGDADINDILEFTEKMRLVSREEVVSDATPLIDKERLVSEMYDKFVAIHQ